MPKAAGVGHNSDAHPDVLIQTAQSELKKIVANIEDMEIEKASVAEAIKDAYGAAKASGFDVKILRKVIRIRKMDTAKRLEEEAITDLYLSALGLL